MTKTRSPHLSVVIPFLNEEASLPMLKKRFAALERLPDRRELLFVSDGSSDRSIPMIEKWAFEDPRVKLLVFTRNFGHQAAISAGLEYATGEFVGIMDADLQDPPEVLLEMYQKIRAERLDIVYSLRSSRRGGWLKRLAYRAFYKLYSSIAESPIDPNSGDFCVLSRRAVDTLASLPERVRFVRGLRSWLGLRAQGMATSRPKRAAGRVQYSWPKLFSLALSGLTSFSVRPLRLAIISGVLMCVSTVGVACMYLGIWYFQDIHESLPGFTTIVLLILFLAGFQIIMIGIIGEYIGQIFIEVKNRPTYLVDRTVNLSRPIGLTGRRR